MVSLTALTRSAGDFDCFLKRKAIASLCQEFLSWRTSFDTRGMEPERREGYKSAGLEMTVQSESVNLVK